MYVVPDLLNEPIACVFEAQVGHHGSLKSYGFGTANMCVGDRLCGLVVRVSGYRYRGLGFDSRRYQIF